MPPERRTKWLARLSMLLAGLALGICVAEAWVRLAGRDPLGSTFQIESSDHLAERCFQPDEATGYAFVPGECNTGALGFKGGDPAPLTPGQRRVLVLGDSIAAGHSFPALLERVLATRHDPPIQVINGAVPGYATPNQLALYEARGAALEPDLVLLQFCLNDYTGTPFLFEHQGQRVLVRDRHATVLGRSAWWLSRSALYRLLSWSPQPTGDSLPVQDRFPGTEAALLRLAERLDAEGRGLLVVVFPLLAPTERWGDLELESQRRVLALLEREGIPHLDLTEPFFQGDPTRLQQARSGELHAGMPDSLEPWGLESALRELVLSLPPHQLKLAAPQAGVAEDLVHPGFLGHTLAAWHAAAAVEAHPVLQRKH